MVEKKTLEEYHKDYPARTGDTAEKFHRYEQFLEDNPYPDSESNYHEWYAKLAKWMEVPEDLW